MAEAFVLSFNDRLVDGGLAVGEGAFAIVTETLLVRKVFVGKGLKILELNNIEDFILIDSADEI